MDKKIIQPNDFKLREKCGLFGVFSPKSISMSVAYKGILALQHRGQDSAGISVFYKDRLMVIKTEGLVSNLLPKIRSLKIKGNIMIAHNRYATSGEQDETNIQPFIDESIGLSLAHNGNLPILEGLIDFCSSKGLLINNVNDSKLIFLAISQLLKEGSTLENAVRTVYPILTGAFSLIISHKNDLYGLGDMFGLRPLCIGKSGDKYFLSSETCGLDIINAEFIREVHPGELVRINSEGISSLRLSNNENKIDVFEYIYFSSDKSNLLGKNIGQVRQNIGKSLAKQYYKIKADFIVPIPQTGLSYAYGYSLESGIPIKHFIRIKKVQRTFIEKSNNDRANALKDKFSFNANALSGKNIILIDDSIVRGSIVKFIVPELKRAGVKNIFLLIGSPPIKFPDFYGINIPNIEELLSAKYNSRDIQKFLNVSFVGFISLSKLINSIGLKKDNLNLSCLTGEYPIDIGKLNKERISNWGKYKKIPPKFK